ncbi:hypothetical protein ACIGXI_01420 [Kitasatospora aureofaciens]|uniref:hypothetical protein n=1 Tax=Kitasatospora aureofaciens TaxID=1894 RepID=UPI0037CBA14C
MFIAPDGTMDPDLLDFVRSSQFRSLEQETKRKKRNREAAAFTKLFRWAKVEPLPVDVGRSEDRAAESVSSNVLWLTPRTWGLWSDIGLRGHTLATVPAAGWESRTELRNTSFVQMVQPGRAPSSTTLGRSEFDVCRAGTAQVAITHTGQEAERGSRTGVEPQPCSSHTVRATDAATIGSSQVGAAVHHRARLGHHAAATPLYGGRCRV